MDQHTADSILEAILATRQEDLKQAFVQAAARYAAYRVRWKLAEQELRQSPGDPDLAAEFKEIDRSRTRCHEALLDACRILARNMGQGGEDAGWWGKIPPGPSGPDRKEVGDLACYLHLRLGLSAR